LAAEVQKELRSLLCMRTGFPENDRKIEGGFRHPWKEQAASWRRTGPHA